MRKIMALFLVLGMGLIGCAAAEGERAQPTGLIAAGSVVSGDTVAVAAPFGGTIEDLDVREGDRVSEGDALFSVDAAPVYAPVSGTVRGILASPGDSAATVLAQYGALLYIEPAAPVLIADQSRAYHSDETETVHVGETVYLQSTDDDDRTGVGTIVALGDGTFRVEVGENNLEADETAEVFRDSDFDSKTRLGRGAVRAQEPLAIAVQEGCVTSISVRDGDFVEKGDALLELGGGEFPGFEARESVARAPAGGIVVSVSVQEGQGAQMDQTVLSLCPDGAMELSVLVGEADLSEIAVGAPVAVSVDSLPDEWLEGTVKFISASGSRTTSGAQFEVRISLPEDERLRLGLSATAYFSAE